MVRGWWISCCLVALVGGAVIAPSRWDHIPDVALRTMETKQHLHAGRVQKGHLLQIDCGSTKLPTPDGEIEVVLEKYDVPFGLVLDGGEVDPKTLDLPPLYEGRIKGGSGVVVMQCDLNGFVRNVEILEDGKLIGMIMPVGDEFPGVVASVEPDSINVPALGQYEMGHIPATLDDEFEVDRTSAANAGDEVELTMLQNSRKRSQEKLKLHDLASRGTGDRRLTVAVAFDASLCALYDGNAVLAITSILSIYLLASKTYYEGTLGLQLQVTYFEANCQTSIYDTITPKVSGCNGIGYLHYVAAFWQENRQTVPRDLMSFITGVNFEDDGTVGCAFRGTICNSSGYSVNKFFTDNVKLLGDLIAHETGHNCGASHSPDGFMYKSLRHQNVNVDVHSQTVTEIAAEVAQTSECLPVNGMCTNEQNQQIPCECEEDFAFSITAALFGSSCVTQCPCQLSSFSLCSTPTATAGICTGSACQGFVCVSSSIATHTCQFQDFSFWRATSAIQNDAAQTHNCEQAYGKIPVPNQ